MDFDELFVGARFAALFAQENIREESLRESLREAGIRLKQAATATVVRAVESSSHAIDTQQDALPRGITLLEEVLQQLDGARCVEVRSIDGCNSLDQDLMSFFG